MSADIVPIEERTEIRIAGTAGAPLRSGGEPDMRRLLRRALILLATVVFVTAMVLGRIVLVPLALASVFSFLLAPLSRQFERARLGRGLSAVLSVAVLVGAFLAVTWIAASQTADLARRMPEYATRIEGKLHGLEASGFAAPFLRGVEGLKRLEGGLAGGDGAPSPSAAAPPAAPPVDVRVVEPPSTFTDSLTSLLGPLLGPLGSAAMVVLLSIFFLCYRSDLRDRLIRLVSRGHIGLTAQALEEASGRLSRYLVAMVLVNAICGLLIGIGLAIVGVPNAPLWGLLAGLLRFVPYIGVWIGAIPPVALSLAVFDGWGHTLSVLLVILGTDFIAGNVVEPLVYGKKMGISPLAVVVATVFWTAVWGVPGLLLALPMTLCLAVVGRYVPGLEFLDVLLGDSPALTPAERVYERLAALDPDGARRVAEESLASVGTEAAFEDVLLAALRLASVGRRLGVLEDARFHDLCVGLLETTDGLAKPDPAAPQATVVGRVLCLPAGDDADRVACELLARLLEARGLDVEVGSPTAMSGEVAERAEADPTRVVCVASIPPLAAPRVRYLVKRIRGRAPAAKILSAVWEPMGDRAALTRSLTAAGADRVAVTLPEAIEGIRRLLAEVVRPAPPTEESPPSASQAGASA
ncbi:MAG TPA: AI-2E family transporter [Planctomycetota bacterium]|nr:AI-2E family transporter [Planctomycetota bacterium]